MVRKFSTCLAMLLLALSATAQHPMSARTNVTPYYDDAAVERLAYRDSPYYMELEGGWQQETTDSSIRYIRSLDVEKSWRDFRIYLNVRAGRAVRLLINSVPVGMGDDSRHWNEFFISPFLQPNGENIVTIEAMKENMGAQLEDPTLAVGLNGVPYLLFKTNPNISDFTLAADYDAATTTGTLTLSTHVFGNKKRGKFYVELMLLDPKGHELDRMGRWVVFNTRHDETVDISRSWGGVEPWSAESPKLYTAIIRLRNEKMEELETVGTRFGFRRVEVKDGVLRLNGRTITLKGVGYSLEQTDDEAAREQMQRDIVEMKRNNINAVHTTHISPVDPFFYELCDRYGLYVVCDANLLPLSKQHQAVATAPEHIPLFEHRVDNMYGKYKNHTSIIVWSLGNTRDNAVCMTAAYRHLKTIEKTRPVLFAGASYGETTDIIALSHPDLTALKQALRKQANRPTLLLSAVDSSTFANLQPLWKVVENNRQLQGVFVDTWPLDATMLAELKHLFRPFDVKLTKLSADEGEFLVTNRDNFGSLARYNLEYNVFSNRRHSITGGDLPVAVPSGSSDKVSMRIPPIDLQAGEELFIRFTLTTRRNAMQPWQSPSTLAAGVVELPLASGKRIASDGMQPPLDADTTMPRRELYFTGHTDWSAECIETQVRELDKSRLCTDRMVRYITPDGRIACYANITDTRFASGDVLTEYTLIPVGPIDGVPLQPAVRLWQAADTVIWFGLDREVIFAEDHAGLTGIHKHAADGLCRRQVRWCALQHGDEGVFMEMQGSPCTMTVNASNMSLIPQEGTSFRLRLRHYRQQDPSTLGGIDFPTSPSVLQPPPPPVATTASIASTTFSRRPSTPYNTGADTILFDGRRGEADELARGWLGFAGEAPVTTVQLTNATDIDYITLRFAHAPATWAFAPQSVVVTLSSDGDTFADSLTATLPFDPADPDEATVRVVELRIPVGKNSITHFRIAPQTLTAIPVWHRAAGLKPWLLMDEIVVGSRQ